MKPKPFVAAIGVLLAVFALALADWQFGGLQLSSRRATLGVGFVTLWLPAACVVLLGFLPRSRARAWAFTGLIPAALLCLALGSVVVIGQSSRSGRGRPASPLGVHELSPISPILLHAFSLKIATRQRRLLT
jgi:hypothetical protein